MGKKPKDDPVKVRIRLPLEMDVASTLIKIIGKTWPRTIIGTPESDLLQDRELVLLIDQQDRHKSAKAAKKYRELRENASPWTGWLTKLSPDGVGIAPEEWLTKTWAHIARQMFEQNPAAANYTESTVFDAETGQRYVFWCARSEGQTPHELRMAAEKRAEELETENAELKLQIAIAQKTIERMRTGAGALDTEGPAAEADEGAAEPMSYSLAEVRNGTGWPKDVRFIAQSGSEADG
ncbi:hypothetical protein SUAREZ_77 [Mycobacterium phage Suarez]|nr:hypothetical protein SUAREZ_77 [Mycobacterium phage Suarez]